MKIANAPCSWGVLEFELDGEAPDYAQVLNEMQAIGYLGTELGDWGFMPTDAKYLRAELAARELKMLGAFVAVALADPETHASGEKAALRHARLLADTAGETPFIVLSDDNATTELRTRYAGRIRPEHGLTPAQWDTFIQGAHRIARSVREETGLRTVFPSTLCRVCRSTSRNRHVDGTHRSEPHRIVFRYRALPIRWW